MKKLKYMQCCVYETIRIRSEGIIGRKVIRDTNIKVRNNIDFYDPDSLRNVSGSTQVPVPA